MSKRCLANAVAVIGMSGRFPGSASLEFFKRAVFAGRVLLETLPEEELRRRGVPDDMLADPDYVRRGAFLSMDPGAFDAGFFGLGTQRARLLDPQQRLFLECAWEALEIAGYATRAVEPRVGVFGGTSSNGYLLGNILSNPTIAGTYDDQDLELGSNKDHVALLAAYSLGLTGPAATVQSCCSTSLLAVHLAVQSLRNGECDIALAGGASLRLPHRMGYRHAAGGILSRSGQCRPFDAAADGTVFGSGAGVVALKPYEEAVADGDTVHAVILGSSVNNDGARKAGYAAPSTAGQAVVLAEGLSDAGVDAWEIGYVEAHGTGTPIGDPIEFAALSEVYRDSGLGGCALGSIKGNIGHLDVASGIAGLIHAVHVARERMVAPLAGFGAPNPALAHSGGPFFFPRTAQALTEGRDCVAVSSFGVGGTNVHLVLCTPPPAPSAGVSMIPLFPLSAQTPSALAESARRLAAHLRGTPSIAAAELAATLQTGRAAMRERTCFAAESVEELAERLERSAEGTSAAVRRPLAWFLDEVGQTSRDAIRRAFPRVAERCQELEQAAPTRSKGAFYNALLDVIEEVGLELDLVLLPAVSGAVPEPDRARARRIVRLDNEVRPLAEGALTLVLADAPPMPGWLHGADCCYTADGPARALAEFIARAFEAGADVDFGRLRGAGAMRRIPLPTYPFERTRHWIDPPEAESPPTARPDIAAPVECARQILFEVTPVELDGERFAMPFLEGGFDSLSLSILIGRFRRELAVPISLSRLIGEDWSPARLLEHVESNAGTAPEEAPAIRVFPSDGRRDGVPDEQGDEPVAALGPFSAAHGRGRPGGGALSSRQRNFIGQLVDLTCRRTAASKRLAETSREVLCDPRSIAGFDPRWKEMVYPIVAETSSGSGFTDLDGNGYVDMVMGFGANYLGHAPSFVTDAVRRQLDLGYEIGPQTPLAGEVAQLIAGLTGCERVAFCNTGSEAVAAALRISRAATRRDKVALFRNSYHGGFDAVLGRSVAGHTGSAAMPIAPGIPASALGDTFILDFGEQRALDFVELHGSELAAVLVEPVQSRRPANVPIRFLHELREICDRRGVVLVFDEVITGFRCHPGGAQALFGVRADIAVYGKVIGGGLPIGAVAGRAGLMDYLDGGVWRYGDLSAPENERTFFAGTFVRHPLAMAAAKAALGHLRDQGPALQFGTTARVLALCDRLNEVFARHSVGIVVRSFASFLAHEIDPRLHHADLLFPLLRSKGVYAVEGRLAHLSTAHDETDMARIIAAYDDSIAELVESDLLPAF